MNWTRWYWMTAAKELDTKERLEQYLYLAGEGGRLAGKYVAGKNIFGSEM